MAREVAKAEEATARSSPGEITKQVIGAFEATGDPRLRSVVQSLTRHLHDFAVETQLTQTEWFAGIQFLTAVGQSCTPERQEMILLSDTLGLSMVVDTVAHAGQLSVTESTVLGPFYVPESPLRPMGSSIAEMGGSGEPTRVSGTVRDLDGAPVAGAMLDVWQNAGNGMYTVQDGRQPAGNLRGRFVTDDGRFSFWSVRPTDYCIPDDGPVGEMLAATGRHAWRPAHLHLIVSALGYEAVTTHFFDEESPHLDSDAVFGVKESLVCHFEVHEAGEEGTPAGHHRRWYSIERDVVLAPTLAKDTSD